MLRPLSVAVPLILLHACAKVDEPTPARTVSDEPRALELAVQLSPESIRSFVVPTDEGLRRVDGVIVSPAERANDPAFDGVGARLPESAEDAFTVGLSRIGRFRGVMRFDGAHGESVVVDRGRALYANVWDDTDLIMVAGHARLESLFVVRSAAAPSDWSFTFELPPGITDVRSEVDRVVLLDRVGEPVLYLPRPFAVDARGTRRDVTMTIEKRERSFRARMHLDRAGLSYPLLVDPAIESSAWESRGGSGTNGAVGYAMAYDANRKVVVLHGGSTVGCASCNQTWEYNGTSWSQKCTSCAVGARDGAGMDYDPIGKRVVLTLGNGKLDTWTWNGTTWTKLPIADASAARSSFAFAIQPSSGKGHVQGGVVGGSASSDNLSLDLASGWSPSIPFSRPSARSGSPLTWDSKRNQFVLFSGSNGTADTWTLTTPGGNWTVVTPPTSPAARVDHGLTFDSVRGKAVLFGGLGDNKTWEFDGTTWKETTPSTSPPTRSKMQLVFAADRRRVVTYGGRDTGSLFYSDTWEYHARGGACTTNADCDTFQCVDGVCCEQASCGACEACNTATLPGVCSKVISADDPDTCTTSTSTCDASGACKLKVGRACTASGQCASGNCIDGFCCGSVCGVCSSCAINPGTCTPVTSAPDPDSCSGAKSCDASGSCKTFNGQACAAASDCSSNFCVDGVCCEALCNKQCEACNVAGSEGKCNAVTGNPVGDRTACRNPGTICGGTCDGKKRDGCVYAEATIKCDARCAGATSSESLCDGAGGCVEQTPKTCLGGFKCDTAGKACLTACTSATDCAGGLVCGSDGLCVPNSATCDGDHTTTDSSGKKNDCTPFKCESNGSCKSACATSDDCVAPRLCDGNKQCSLPPDSSEESSGGCSTTTHSAKGSAFALLIGAALALTTRRRVRS